MYMKSILIFLLLLIYPVTQTEAGPKSSRTEITFPIVIYVVNGADGVGHITKYNSELLYSYAPDGLILPYYGGYFVIDKYYNIKYFSKSPLDFFYRQGFVRAQDIIEKKMSNFDFSIYRNDEKFLYYAIEIIFTMSFYSLNSMHITFGLPPDDAYIPHFQKEYFLPAKEYEKEFPNIPDGSYNGTIVIPLPGMRKIELYQ